MLPDAAMIEDDTPPGNRTPRDGDEVEVEDEEGMLPRDYQQKTAYYDYVADKQLSQADAKLFYQRSQKEGMGGSNWGNSQSSPQGSPVIIPRSISNGFDSTQAGIRRSDSVNSVKSSGKVLSPRLALVLCVYALDKYTNSFLAQSDTNQLTQLAYQTPPNIPRVTSFKIRGLRFYKVQLNFIE